jgi:hypothetical protein
MATQVERLLLNPQFADLSQPQYAQLRAIDFPDAVREALRIEVATKRGDWSLPDIEPEQAVKELLEAAEAAPPKPAQPEHRLAVQIDEEEAPEAETPSAPQTVVKVDNSKPHADTVPSPKPQQALPQRVNTPFPIGGIMLDGSAPPTTSSKPVAPTPAVVVDPWAAPVKSTPDNLVPVGAKIRMGLAAADKAGKK